MAINYAHAIKNGFKFGFTPKRWLPFFITDIIFFSALLVLTLSNLQLIISSLAGFTTNPLALGSLLGYGAVIVGGFIIWFLVKIWIQGAVVHQSYKEKEFDKSWRVAYKKYLSLLAVVIVVALISFIVSTVIGFIPYIGWALTIIASIIIGLMFFFVLQGIIVSKLGFYKSMKSSYYMFRDKPFEVFIMWLLVGILSIVILGIFSLPIVVIFSVILSNIFLGIGLSGAAAAADPIMTIVSSLQTYLVPIIVSGVILIVGLAISQTFALKAQTEFYQQIKKKKFGLF